MLSDRTMLPAIQALHDQGMRLRILGGASNVILPETIEDVVVLMRLRGIELVDDTPTHWVIDVAGGENWHEWVSLSISKGWYGLENLALIPGSVGAAPVQNIGAYGVELMDRVQAIEVWDFEQGRARWLSRDACGFGYRDSIFKHAAGEALMVIAVRFELTKDWKPVLDYPDLRQLQRRELQCVGSVCAKDVFNEVVAVRQAKLPDPVLMPNVGSFFKNPVLSSDQAKALQSTHPGLVCYEQADGKVKLAAGWLIDQCGWKGVSRGPVGVHARQALVIVSHAGARAQDVRALAQAICQDVQDRFGVMLEREPVDWGA